MLTKAVVCCCVLASAPLLLSTSQDPRSSSRGPAPAAPVLRDTQDAELARLRAELREARELATKLRAQLAETLDMLVANARTREHNCTPSRRLLTQYQYLHEHGHAQHAEKLLTQLIGEPENDTNRLNSLAWHLMTEKETVGKFDAAALAIAERMEKSGNLPHRHLDTVALAKFLNGKVADAIRLQREAIRRGGNDDDYRRRLRTYEAALAFAQPGRPVVPALANVAASDD